MDFIYVGYLNQVCNNWKLSQHLPGQGIHDATEDGESLLSLACSAGYYELAEVLLRMRASVEDRGVKGHLIILCVRDTSVPYMYMYRISLNKRLPCLEVTCLCRKNNNSKRLLKH